MVLPGGKVIATKTLAIAGGALVAVAGITAGVMLVINGQKSYRNISVVDAIGGVCILRQTDTYDAYKGMTLFAGDDVTTGPGAELDMQLDSDKYVYIEENTHMWLEAEGDADNSKTIIYLNEGAVLNKIDNKLSSDSVYQVETPNSTMSIRGTVVRVAVYKDEEGIVHSDFAVPEGNVEVALHTLDGEPMGEPVIIPQGYQVKTVGDETFSEVVMQPVGEDGNVQELAPIDLSEFPESTHQVLADIVMSGRPLYVGEKEVLNDDTHVFLGEPKDEPEVSPEVTPAISPEITPEVTPEIVEIVPSPVPTVAAVKTIEVISEPTPEVTVAATTPVPENVEEESAVTPTPEGKKTYTVTFKDASGNTFGTQTVEEGSTPQVPLFNPSSSGSWSSNISSPVTSDVTISWQ